MQFAFGVLHMTPHTFWAMSFAEWTAAEQGYHTLTQGTHALQPMLKQEMDDLAAQFPDKMKDHI